ncbi:hypothetical protein [Streptomyces sp. MNP-20]|uniref:hypothetical protein n=1 Tax=Streptomyces sp. MNP-20 TaxID=2721165 RepID=UPI00155474CA|nr:hypothetical protein [Streptomyces sp. MNP-20]
MSRVVVAASVVATLGLTAACGGGDGGGRDGAKSSTERAEPKGSGGGESGGTGAADGSGGSGGSSGGASSGASGGGRAPAKLTAASLAKGDVRGHDVAPRRPNKLEAAWAGAPASPAACAPLADLLTSATPPGAKGHVGRTVTGKSTRAMSTTDVELYAYDDEDAAERALAGLRAATKAKKCSAFRTGDLRYSGVKALTAPDKGDGAVSYRLGGRQSEFVKRWTVTVVRKGSTLVSFAASSLYDPQGVARDDESREDGGFDQPTADRADTQPKVPAAVMDAQLAKVK